MSTWMIVRETGASRPASARPAVSSRRVGGPEVLATSRETPALTSSRRFAEPAGSRACVGLHRLVERSAELPNLRLQRVDPVEHLLDRLAEGIGQVGVLEIDACRGDTLAVAVDDLARNAHHHRVRRDLGDHDRSRADAGPLAHPERAHHRGAGAHHDVALERGMPLLALEARAAEGDPLVEGHVVPDLRGLPNHDAHPVVDEDTRADAGPWVDLDACQESRDVRYEARGHYPARAPQAVRQPVEGERVNPRVAEHHLEPVPRRWIALHRGIHIPPDPLKHGRSPGIHPSGSAGGRPSARPRPWWPRAAGPRAALREPPRRPQASTRPARRPAGRAQARSRCSKPQWTGRSRKSGTWPPALGHPRSEGRSAPGRRSSSPRSPPPHPDSASSRRSGAYGSGPAASRCTSYG